MLNESVVAAYRDSKGRWPRCCSVYAGLPVDGTVLA